VKHCELCNKHFQASVSYQIYCSTDCRDIATKEKIAERQQVLKRQKRKNKVRYCVAECGTRLSMYNDNSFCDKCNINPKEVKQVIKEIKSLVKDDEAKS
jgi:hypothetical protein